MSNPLRPPLARVQLSHPSPASGSSQANDSSHSSEAQLARVLAASQNPYAQNPSALNPSAPAPLPAPLAEGTQALASRPGGYASFDVGARTAPESTRYIGATIDGRYYVESVLGEGGMGVVYAARHTLIDKKCAIKILKSEFARDKEIMDRFVLEAKTASSIGNPHIIDISDFGKLPDGSTYFVMEFIEGQSLADAATEVITLPGGAKETRTTVLQAPRICHIAKQICDGLGAAHKRDIVHRDLKPDNVMLLRRGSGDFVKILDFGIAKVTTSAKERLTRAGAVFGTPQYMSPEQATGSAQVDHRSDIYSLGIILYELASGELPFDADNYMGILTMHMYRAPTAVRACARGANCPPGLEAIIQKCLSKKPEHRYQSMGELHEDLSRLESNEAPKAIADVVARAHDDTPPDYFSGGDSAAQDHLAGPPVWLWVTGVIGVIGIVGGGLYWKHTRDLRSLDGRSTQADVAAEAPARTASPRMEEVSAIATEPRGRELKPQVHVTLDVSPDTATITRDGTVVTRELDVAPNAPFAIEVSAPGYETLTRSIDGSEPKVSLRLNKSARGASTYAPSVKGGSRGTIDTW